jgi:hypothetical protein
MGNAPNTVLNRVAIAPRCCEPRADYLEYRRPSLLSLQEPDRCRNPTIARSRATCERVRSRETLPTLLRREVLQHSDARAPNVNLSRSIGERWLTRSERVGS